MIETIEMFCVQAFGRRVWKTAGSFEASSLDLIDFSDQTWTRLPVQI